MTIVQIHHEVSTTFDKGWQLCFQHCTYRYDEDTTDEGYRFIWRLPDGTFQNEGATAGEQARIPDANTLQILISKATAAGWYR